jgi:hypothetical protein
MFPQEIIDMVIWLRELHETTGPLRDSKPYRSIESFFSSRQEFTSAWRHLGRAVWQAVLAPNEDSKFVAITEAEHILLDIAKEYHYRQTSPGDEHIKQLLWQEVAAHVAAVEQAGGGKAWSASERTVSGANS